MLYKAPKPQSRRFLRKAATVLFIAEGLFFVGVYAVWNRLNTDRDYRKYMHKKYPSVLEFYYSLGEKLGAPAETKSIDLAHWEKEN